MDPQDSAVGLMEPGQDDDLLADRNPVQAILDFGIQDQERIRCAFIPLPRRIGRRDERTLDAPNRADCEVGGGRVSHVGHSITAPSRKSECVRH